MRFETTTGNYEVHLETDAALLAMVHLAVGGQLAVKRHPDLSDGDFARLCRPRLPLGENGTFVPLDQADTTTGPV